MSSEKSGSRSKMSSKFDDDPVVRWANSIAADPTYQGEACLEHFVQLRDQYVALLRRFARVTRISDSYQHSLKELNESLAEAARQDHLTGLPNRRAMLDELADQIGRAERYGEEFALILADIDDFKRVNDTRGHEAGDHVLVSVAHTLESSIRGEDICARWGGEEFLICLPHTELNGAQAVADKLLEAVAKLKTFYEERQISTTISAGIAVHHGSESLDATIAKADNGMFEAKHQGKNRVYVLE